MLDEMSKAELLLVIRNLRERIRAFESGEKYTRMKEDHRKAREADARLIRRRERELAEARRERIHTRDLWLDVIDKLQEEHEKEITKKDAEIARLKKALEKAYASVNEEHRKKLEKLEELYAVKTELEDEKEKNAELNARLNKDYTNSSKSSSQSPNHTKIHNGREKTGRRPGGQPGHEHHPRKKHEPSEVIDLPTPKEYKDRRNYTPTGKYVTKQKVDMFVFVYTTEYRAKEYRNNKTGQRVCAPFPKDVVDDVNYGGSVKAFAYLLNNACNVSVEKTRKFMFDVTQGELNISSGMICNLARQFSQKTKKEREEVFRQMATAPILHVDFTFGRVNGKQGAVIVSVIPNGPVLYQARAKKGDEGVKGSPLEFYTGTTVSDHEAAIIKHGTRHQECLAHIKRYLQGIQENEPNRKWSSEMLAWIKDAVKYWNEMNSGDEEYDSKRINHFINEYDRILEIARDEYEYDPPSKYNRDGYNTFQRMYEDKEHYILFLRDVSVPPTNNAAERAGRKYKRKMAEVMCFRSLEGSARYCDGLSIMESIKASGMNLYEGIQERFER